MAIELFTERMLLKDILPDKAKDIAKKYKLKEDNIEFIRKKNPLKAEDLQIEDGERAAIRYINTADLDRDNEIVLPSGGQVNDFKKSPTVLYAHNYQGLPIGKDIWLKNVQGKGWLAKTVYAKHQLASDVYNLVKEKFLNTSSIGFIPLESVNPDKKGWDKAKDKVIADYAIPEKIVDQAKRIYTKWIMLEHSDVPIPSNINALNIAVGKGLEIKSKELRDDLELEIVDEEEKVTMIEHPVTVSDVESVTASTREGDEYEVVLTKDMITKTEETEEKEVEKEEKEEPTKNLNLDEIYEIVKENKELIKTLEEMSAELKAGAVLNKRNKADLKDAQSKIQNVLDSAETAEPVEEGKEADGIEIEDSGEPEKEDKEEEEKTNTGIDVEILKSAFKDFFSKYQEENKRQDVELYTIINGKLPEIADIFYKKMKGKVM